MARLRSTKVVNVLAFEEKTRLTNFFSLLVEIDLRLPKSAKTKTKKRATKQIKRQPINKKPCYIKCPAICCSALRDLYLQSFTRIFNCNQSNFIKEYHNDRYYSFIANTKYVLHQ